MDKLIIKTLPTGEMFINGFSIGTGGHTQYGMTGDPSYVIALLKKQTSDKRGTTIGIYHVYNKFCDEDMKQLSKVLKELLYFDFKMRNKKQCKARIEMLRTIKAKEIK